MATFDEFGGTIGRAPENLLPLPDPERTVSRVHACVRCRQSGYSIEALGTNPTLVNGVPLERGLERPLRPGDSIQIGAYVIDVLADVATTVETAAAVDDPDESAFSDTAAPPLEAFPPPVSASRPILASDWDPFEADSASAGALANRAPFRGADVGSSSGVDELFDLTPPTSPTPPQPSAPALTTAQAPDDVRLGAAAPRTVGPGQSFIVHCCIYPAGHEPQVRETLALQNPRAIAVLSKRSCRWSPGTVVEVSLSAEDLQCDEPTQRLVWNGAVEVLDFVLRAPEAAPQGERIVTFRVCVAQIVVATLRQVVVLCADAHAARDADKTTAYARAASSGFASYASRDRELVSHLVGAIEQSSGIDLFCDCLDLRPGEQWKPRLAAEIRQRDVFVLFWSREARGSAWVEWEWRTALLEKGLPAIQIHPLQMNVEPPPELSALHVGSIHTLVAEFERLRSGR